MRRFVQVALLALVLATATGCAGTAQGYFYLVSTSQGYVVTLSTGGTPSDCTLGLSKPLPLPEAKALCDQLNRDLGNAANK